MRTRSSLVFVAAAVLVAASCSGPGGAPAPAPAPAPGAAPAAAGVPFADAAETFYNEYLARTPTEARGLGYHEYDGKLPDVSPAAIADTVAWLRDNRARFEAYGELEGMQEVERQVLLAHIRSELFTLDVRKAPVTDPMFYGWAAGLIGYVDRDYAPVSERLAGLIAACNAAPAYFAQAQSNLPRAMPRTWVQTALLMTRGAIQFARNDVPAAMPGLGAGDRKRLDAALATYVGALDGYRRFLEDRLATATDDYAIGEERFLQMLRDTEGLDIDLARLTDVGRADLERNLASLEAAAARLAPGKTILEAVDMVRAQRPAVGEVLAVATRQSADMRKQLIDKKIVSIPSDHVAEVRDTPPFMRFNFAFMSSPGPFEERELPSFYYITPPDPSWPQKKQDEYVASTHDLLFVTIHEVWPGHFLHGLHKKKNPSKILRSFCSYAMSEGWAHYTEEMMWDAGATSGEPAVHIGQLQNALLRNVRFMSAIGLHTGGMTVAQARQMFLTQGYQDEGNADQQAVRGTFDPGYLNYTLGKLMIRKLHDDWRAARGADYTIGGFHDAFLAHGCAPIPVIRRSMLGPNAGPAL